MTEEQSASARSSPVLALADALRAAGLADGVGQLDRGGDLDLDEETIVLEHAWAALQHAATVPGAGPLALAAADALDTLDFERAADAVRGIRGMYSYDLEGLDTPAAHLARAAGRAIAGAAMIPVHGDEEWTTCADLLRTAADLARASGEAGA